MIGAFVHRKVISDGNLGGGISVGCVLILKQVGNILKCMNLSFPCNETFLGNPIS